MLRRLALSSVGLFVLLALALFVPAGLWRTPGRWPQAWAFLALFAALCFLLTLWMWRHDRALLAARIQPITGGDQDPRDRAIAALLLAAFAVWVLEMGFARRLGAMGPLWLQCLGAALITLAFLGYFAAFRANSFAASNVRVQRERGQRVISSGPYALVRHPIYAATIPFFIGMPLLLATPLGLLGLAVLLPLLALRALGEETVLRAGLPGYPDYCARVRWRLIPGLW